ncbi:type II secretion system GspH family protein [Motilimonas cestriensis]|uniref:Type II secretion system GspH family protein n=1 Tax=Motilimonas cestriensis TaxID=2742685 RepID=A0ABS8WCN6_9GAMM|nr:type II secretion system protein [Motilimonas cestriensis]MCE2596040.1 type II secretion system GspH family protein [Motilimonas cestriensis]
MKKNLTKQSGFTLIELVIVIIVLGILAATAAPKFIDLQSDAKKSALNGLKAAFEGGATLTYSKAAIAGKEKVGDTTVSINGVDVGIAYGYPKANETELKKAVDLSTGDWAFGTASGSPASIEIYAVDTPSASVATCSVKYTQAAASNARPTIAATSTGC